MSGENFGGGPGGNFRQGTRCDSLVESLVNNIGRIVTIFTTSGGVSGCGFTGLLSCASCESVKLVTTPATAPPHPFCGRRICSGSSFSNVHAAPIRYGSVCVIPTNKIVCFTFSEV